MIIIHYYCHHCQPFFVQGANGEGAVDQSLGGSLGSDRGDTVLLEVGGHGRVAAQSLTRALQPSVALYDPGAAASLFSQHVAAAGGRRGSDRYRGAHRQAFGLLSGGGEVWVVALEHAGDMVQEVVKELWDALITWKYRGTLSQSIYFSFWLCCCLLHNNQGPGYRINMKCLEMIYVRGEKKNSYSISSNYFL